MTKRPLFNNRLFMVNNGNCCSIPIVRFEPNDDIVSRFSSTHQLLTHFAMEEENAHMVGFRAGTLAQSFIRQIVEKKDIDDIPMFRELAEAIPIAVNIRNLSRKYQQLLDELPTQDGLTIPIARILHKLENVFIERKSRLETRLENRHFDLILAMTLPEIMFISYKFMETPVDALIRVYEAIRRNNRPIPFIDSAPYKDLPGWLASQVLEKEEHEKLFNTSEGSAFNYLLRDMKGVLQEANAKSLHKILWHLLPIKVYSRVCIIDPCTLEVFRLPFFHGFFDFEDETCWKRILSSLIEFSNGNKEIPMPSFLHDLCIAYFHTNIKFEMQKILGNRINVALKAISHPNGFQDINVLEAEAVCSYFSLKSVVFTLRFLTDKYMESKKAGFIDRSSIRKSEEEYEDILRHMSDLGSCLDLLESFNDEEFMHKAFDILPNIMHPQDVDEAASSLVNELSYRTFMYDKNDMHKIFSEIFEEGKVAECLLQNLREIAKK